MIDKVKIGYQIYTIEMVDGMDDLDGDCDADAAVIRIDKNQAQPWRLTNTVIHELLHAVWDQWCDATLDDDTQERIVSGIANGLTAILADNPEITIQRLVRADDV